MRLRNVFERHLWLSLTMSMLSLTTTLILAFLVFYWQTEQANQRHADTVAKQSAAKTVRVPLCNLVYAYEHLDQNTVNTKLVVSAWHGIGILAACPDGIKPKGAS
jgi:hypothetical protein